MGNTTQQPDGRTGAGARGILSRLIEDLARAPHLAVERAWERPLVPGDRIDRFEILREIGRGGFGVVYEALDPELNRKVALKTLRPGRHRHELSEEWLRREADATARLDHPAIVTVLDAGTCERGPWIAEELLRGETMEARLARGRLPPREALAVALEIAAALAHAHGRGLLHRDLKPGNVFLTESGRVKLLDLGARAPGRHARRGRGRNAGVHGAGAGARGSSGRARRRVRARGDPLRDARGDAAVPGARGQERRPGPRPGAGPPSRSARATRARRPAVHRSRRREAPRAWRRRRRGSSGSGEEARSAARPPARCGPRRGRRVPGRGGRDGDHLATSSAPTLASSGGATARRRRGFHEPDGRPRSRRAGGPRRHRPSGVARASGAHSQPDARPHPADRRQGCGADRRAARARQGLVGDAGLPAAAAAAPVAQLVTANLEAYRHYSMGRSLEDRGLPGAKEAYRKAIELDPDFALAHYALAKAASLEKAPIGELGAIATVAIRVADRAPWREGRLIRAWNAIFERRVADARALYREVLERHPDDKDVLALYAAVAASAEESLAYLERALLTDPTYVPAQEQIVGALRDLGRPAELIPLARAWLAQPQEPRRLGAAARALAAAGDLEGALDAAKREDLLSPGRSMLEAIHMARGEYREAERTARERIQRSGTAVGPLAFALSYQGRRGEALAVLDDASRRGPVGAYAALSIAAGDGPSDRLRARARELAAPRRVQDWFAALALAVAGDVPEAERHAMDLSREQADPGSAVSPDEVSAVRRFIQARAAHARSDWATGRAILRDLIASPRYKVRVITAFTLGQACAEEGDLGCAVAALRQHRAEHSPFVLFQSWMFPRSTLLLAEVLERQGQREEARRLVEGLLLDWSSADPDLARARALCSRLECRLPAPGARRPPAVGPAVRSQP